MKKTSWIALAVVAVLIGGGIYWAVKQGSKPGRLDGFAQCLKTKGATFYGAFWCPHCQNQKKLFGSSQKYLPYVECSNPSGQRQTQICIDQKIESYPTWEFADKSRLTGEIDLRTLAEKTGCTLPE